MAESGDDNDFIEPTVSYQDDPKRPDAYLIVKVDIPGLKKNFSGTLATNGEIAFDVHERSFSLTVTARASKSQKKYRYSVKNLICAVHEDKRCYYRVRKDTVVLYLAKMKSERCDSSFYTGAGLEL